MKAVTKKEPTVFKPVKLELTFETKEELDLFVNLMSCDLRVPNYLESEDEIKAKDVLKLSSIMYTIYQGLVL